MGWSWFFEVGRRFGDRVYGFLSGEGLREANSALTDFLKGWGLARDVGVFGAVSGGGWELVCRIEPGILLRSLIGDGAQASEFFRGLLKGYYERLLGREVEVRVNRAAPYYEFILSVGGGGDGT